MNDRITGELDANSYDQAKQTLEEQNLVVVTLRERTTSVWKLDLGLWVSQREITFFTKNFSVMLSAGLTVVEALIIAEGQATGRLKSILHATLEYVESGHSLADGFAQHKRNFSGIYIDIIRTGEISGTLARNFEQLAERLAADLDLRRKIIGALLYPIIVVFAIVALGSTLAVYVMPNLIRLFNSIKVPLPVTTKWLLAGGTWLAETWFWLLIGIVFSAIALRLVVRISVVEGLWHRIILMLPIIGRVAREINLSRITSTFGSLLRSGVPIAEALQTVAHSSTNHVYRLNLQKALQHIEHGGNLATFFEHYPALYPALMSRMVAVGERTAQLDSMLLYLGKYYEQEVDASTKQLGVILEPALLIVIAVVVVFVGLSVIQPIYQFTASIGRI
ncbi:MAG: hypothetical protein ACD_72C00195G0002 [uncultured bacterium]|nr:MAG: hypothetical protein ACD_72C00195G0002 [uncultured bacterium]